MSSKLRVVRTPLAVLTLMACCWPALAADAAAPGADGAGVWRQDLLERVTLKATAAGTDLKALQAQDSRGRLQKPEVARWIKVGPKTGADGACEPVAVVGCRNGAFSGQVVVRAAGAIKVTATELKSADGRWTIPASAVQLRYGIVDGGRRQRVGNSWFDGLEEIGADGNIPQGGGPSAPVQPVWITVRVPRDAAPGEYAGSLSVVSGAAAAKVPVKLKVADWTLPEARDFVSHMGMFQSPDALALKYKVPMWSEEHWKLIEKSFALMAQAGNDEVYITCINKTHLGNEHSMVRFIRKKEVPGVSVQVSAGEKKDGAAPDTRNLTPDTYTPDFSIAEKYLDLALKHFGKTPVICLYVWEYNTGYGWHWNEQDPRYNKKQQEAATITVVDPKTGALGEDKAPFWGTPESSAFWKPVVAGMREILRKRGLEKSLMLGLAGDARPPRIAETDFRTIAPDVKWVLQSHPYQEKLWAQPLGLGAFVWGALELKAKHAKELQFGWRPKKSGMIYCMFARGGFTIGSNPEQQRYFMERCLASGMDGTSRNGADFWWVDTGRKRLVCVAGRYGNLPGAVALDWSGNPSWLSAGRSGPIASASFELVREGIQEAEARIFIEKALADPALCAKLGGDLEKRCRGVLADRVDLILAVGQIYHIAPNENKVTVPNYVPLDWQGQSEKLFAAAGEVAARLGPLASR